MLTIFTRAGSRPADARSRGSCAADVGRSTRNGNGRARLMRSKSAPTAKRWARAGSETNGRAVASLTVRPAVPGDFVPLSFFFDTALRNDYFLRRGQLRDILRSPHHQVFVAEIDAVLVGVAITTRNCRLVNALVHPGYRGLGIGRALIEASSATEVRCKRDMSSGDPIEFYSRLGFHSTGKCNDKGNIELLQRHGQPHGADGADARRRRPHTNVTVAQET